MIDLLMNQIRLQPSQEHPGPSAGTFHPGTERRGGDRGTTVGRMSARGRSGRTVPHLQETTDTTTAKKMTLNSGFSSR